MSKCIICGGRDFDVTKMPYDEVKDLEQKLCKIFQEEEVDEEVCGMAVGADMYGATFAKCFEYPVKEFPAYWDNLTPSDNEPVSIGVNKFGKKYNKIAGINRNRRMAEYAAAHPNGIVIALPGGSGTLNMINVGFKHGLKVYKYNIETKQFDTFMPLKNKSKSKEVQENEYIRG
jgi:hypothetical protein